jgi:hypothetical protein
MGSLDGCSLRELGTEVLSEYAILVLAVLSFSLGTRNFHLIILLSK